MSVVLGYSHFSESMVEWDNRENLFLFFERAKMNR